MAGKAGDFMDRYPGGDQKLLGEAEALLDDMLPQRLAGLPVVEAGEMVRVAAEGLGNLGNAQARLVQAA